VPVFAHKILRRIYASWEELREQLNLKNMTTKERWKTLGLISLVQKKTLRRR